MLLFDGLAPFATLFTSPIIEQEKINKRDKDSKVPLPLTPKKRLNWLALFSSDDSQGGNMPKL